MPASPGEAMKKADDALGLQQKIGLLVERKREIEDSFIKAGMDVPDIDRSMNATVHNAGAFEVRSPEEAEALARSVSATATATATVRTETTDDITAEIKSISDELMSIEVRMLDADINGDDEEKKKLEMMASSLRSRRAELVEKAKVMRTEKQSPKTFTAPDEETVKRIEAIEAENRALRSQVSDVRTSVQDIKDQLRQIMMALGIEDDE